jgi:hypothetical protein
VGLSKADTPIKEQRIIGVGRIFGHCLTGGMRQPVVRTDDKIGETVTRIEGILLFGSWMGVIVGQASS